MRSTLHIFCKLGLAPARGSDHPKKRKVRSTLHKAPVQGSDPHPKKKEKCDPPSTISVSSDWHLFQVQTPKKRKVPSTLNIFCKLGLALVRISLVFFRLDLRKHRKKKGQRDPHSHQLTEVSDPYHPLSPHFL